MTLPLTHAEVLAVIEASEPATAEEVRRGLGLDWPQRGTVRNRILDLIEQGLVIFDENRPQRYAINQFATAADNCQYCVDGVCAGCCGTGRHPMAGQGNPSSIDFVSDSTKCSWCDGDGRCSADAGHAPKAVAT